MSTRRAKRGKASGAISPVHRTDRLPCPANPGKVRQVEATLDDWRTVATTVAAVQWDLFFRAGSFDPTHDAVRSARNELNQVRTGLLRCVAGRFDGGPLAIDMPVGVHDTTVVPGRRRRIVPLNDPVADPLSEAKALVGAAAVQMIRYQVVGILRSFVSNLANEVSVTIRGSTLDPRTKHLLNAVNRSQAWFDRSDELVLWLTPDDRQKLIVEATPDGVALPFVMNDKGRVRTVVPMEVRRLTRRIMRKVMARHRRPSMAGIGMVLDGRIAELEETDGAKYANLWLRVAFPRRPLLHLPIRSTKRLHARVGVRSNAFQLGVDRSGRIAFAVVTEVGEALARELDDYKARTEFLSLDFGLRSLLATDRGDLLGRKFLAELKRFDRTIQGIARHVQRSGRKPRSSERYRRFVRQLRDYVRMEVNRCLNRAVALHAPALLVMERLDFRNPDLSRRLNRIVSNCGRAAVRAKLRQLEETKGIRHEEVHAAYSSRECRLCSYVDPANRRGDRFECRWCGHRMHADVHAARVIGSRRSRSELEPGRDAWTSKDAVLDAAVRRHFERHEGRPGPSPDPRTTNRYYREWNEARSRTKVTGTGFKALSTPKSE